MKKIYRSEFLEEFRSGRREFSGILIQFCELECLDFPDLVIKNSKIEFTSFRDSNLKDVKFLNCEFFFVSFYGCELENTVFDKCRIDMARMDNMRVKNTKIINSSISLCGLMKTDTGEIDFRNTKEFKVIRNISELTPEDAMEIVKRLGMHSEALPIEVRIEVKNTVNRVMTEFSQKGVSDIPGKLAKGMYKTEKPYSRAEKMYGIFDSITESLMKYGESYKPKDERSTYKAKRKY